MSDILIGSEDLEKLRQAILTSNPEPMGFYPIMLIQLSTKGPAHNHAPISVRKNAPSTASSEPDESVDVYRFYFDGLIVHFECRHLDNVRVQAIGKVVVGAAVEIGLLTIDYEYSFQAENLRRVQQETEADHSAVLKKLAWPPLKF